MNEFITSNVYLEKVGPDGNYTCDVPDCNVSCGVFYKAMIYDDKHIFPDANTLSAHLCHKHVMYNPVTGYMVSVMEEWYEGAS